MLTTSIRKQEHTIKITLDEIEIEQAILAYVRLRKAMLDPLHAYPEDPLLPKDTKFKLTEMYGNNPPEDLSVEYHCYTFVFESHSEEEA